MNLNLLPHQFELLKDTTTPILGMVAGYGSGKTYAVCRKAVQLSLLNPGCDGIITEPNFPLLDQILIPDLKAALDEFQVDYTYTNGYFNLVIHGQKSRIIPKSMESWERLIGINAAYVILDEFDTTKMETALKAYQKLLGRLRVGNVRQMVIVSTPEGFSAMHQIFVTDANSKKRLIHASTLDNYHLPREYIETMIQNYPKELIEAYLNGKFVNLTQGSVYRFLREQNDTFREDQNTDCHLMVDFNVGQMSALIGLFKDQKLYIVKEFSGYLDTPALIQAIKEYLIKTDPKHSRRIVVYPDASGKNRTQIDGAVTNHKLLKAEGWTIRVNPTNPRVQDRVNTVNARLENHTQDGGDGVRLFVNIQMCPELVKGLEQQVYDKGKPDKTQGVDHLLDALGYGVCSLMPMTTSKIARKRESFAPRVNE